MRVYFGDNQFLGVNHSAGKGGDYLSKYSTAENVADTLREAWDAGIKDFCFTVNDKTIEAINMVIDDCPFNLHPALPYAHRINQLILDKGLAGAVVSKIKQFGFIKLFIASFLAMMGKNKRLMLLLIRSEMVGIPMTNVKSIGLLNITTDFVLGSDRYDLLYDFYCLINDEFCCKPIFYTMNFSKLSDALWGKGYSKCAIVFNYNKSGFRTNPSLQETQRKIELYSDMETIAMSLFSGSKVHEIESLLSQAVSLSGVLFGSSRIENIRANQKVISAFKSKLHDKECN